MSRKKRDILLVEPDYKNKYPPLGLMKIASYHRLRGDSVTFVKGFSPESREKKWDRIYITTLFTFYWNKIVQTIKYYSKSTASSKDIFVGGIMATLMKQELEEELLPTVDVTIFSGLIDESRMIDDDTDYVVEDMIPNYSILDDIEYKYGMSDGYIGYATRGCVNNCKFCAVRRLEPYTKYRCQRHSSIVDLVRTVDELYGPKRDLLLLDNNILASPDFKGIIKDALLAGFEKGAMQNRKLRRLDFNQGLDARLLTVTKAKLLAQTAITPIRLAFDHTRMKTSYEKAVKLTCEYGMTKQATYVLFNYNDTPEDFYRRLEFNLQLNQKLEAKISSFPMKYIPLNAKNRKFIGKHWHRKMIRGVQCVLLATKGMVSPNPEFFYRAFGENEIAFREICMMPEHYIIWRDKNEERAKEWKKLYRVLSQNQMNLLSEVLAKGKIKRSDCMQYTGRLRRLMEHYIES